MLSSKYKSCFYVVFALDVIAAILVFSYKIILSNFFC